MISMSDCIKHATGAAILAAAVISLVISAGCASAPATAPPVRLDFPAPDSGPGRPDLSRADQEHIDKGWKALLSGDPASARAIASQAGVNPAAELLSMQATLVASSGDPVSGLEQLATEEPEYAAAWLTLSVAAENADDEKIALEAASRGAKLWSDKRWREREQRLRQRYVGDRIDSARELYETEYPEAALEALQPALALDPDNRDAVLVKARALIALDQPDRAEVALSGLPRDSEVVRLSGNIAEARGDLGAAMRIYSSLPDDPDAMLLAVAIAESQDDWLAAMNLYTSLPDERPEKGPGLRRAKLRWRLSVMPEYVQEAVASLELERAQLAVLVVTLAPKVETLTGGQVPLLSDVMTLPSQNEILTATRLGLIESDKFLHRFHPERPVTAFELRTAVDNLAQLLELERPRWCTDETDNQPCAAVAEPIHGEAVATIVIEMVTQEGGTE
jgi:tetratricopeptide (TPR) repeat protein